MPSIYVGTYEKYNNGNLFGEWVDVEKFSDHDEFLEYCRQLHKDEDDPELMYQDIDEIPRLYYSESGIDPRLWDYLSLDDDDKELLEAYREGINEEGDIEDARDAYQGQYDNDIDFIMELLESCGDIPKDLPSYLVIDWEATTRNLMYDFVESNGYYFRNC